MSRGTYHCIQDWQWKRLHWHCHQMGIVSDQHQPEKEERGDQPQMVTWDLSYDILHPHNLHLLLKVQPCILLERHPGAHASKQARSSEGSHMRDWKLAWSGRKGELTMQIDVWASFGGALGASVAPISERHGVCASSKRKEKGGGGEASIRNKIRLCNRCHASYDKKKANYDKVLLKWFSSSHFEPLKSRQFLF